MIKIIACSIFKPYIELLDMNLDIVYLEIEGHNYPKKLAKQIQAEIDKCQDYKKIILLYGLCGNALLNITARNVPVYVVRVHDCLSILLGSTKRFYEIFQERLSCGWSCYSLENVKISFDNFDKEEQLYLESILNLKKDVYVSFSMKKEILYEKQYNEIIKGDLSFLKSIILLESEELLEINSYDQLRFDENKILIKEKRNG